MNPNILLSKIAENFPKIQWKNLQHITSGWDFDVIILDNKIVFRFPKDEECLDNLKKEINLLKKIESKISAKIPHYIYIAKDKSFAGYNIVSGKNVSVSKYKNMTQAEKKLLQNKIADFLTSLHKTPSSILKNNKTRIVEPEQFFQRFHDNTIKYVFPKLNKKEKEIVTNHLNELKSHLLDKLSPVLVHGDIGEDHIFWNKTKKELGIIDFADHHIGDPAKDFSRLFKYGKKFVNKVYALYKGPKDNNLLKRASLDYKNNPLIVMKCAICGDKSKFKKAYSNFQKRFNLN
ncbi:aminoglycoside phosphotransferase family protein [Patescibacteria group bacterium]|nr:aminoglycoside phosphotransferase family protein [Patescibacteria group bacterium]